MHKERYEDIDLKFDPSAMRPKADAILIIGKIITKYWHILTKYLTDLRCRGWHDKKKLFILRVS